ncbi:MAG: hypothetical protein IAE99_09425 [Rhodothermales bacterium]|nr:hypothetical protein [Rhodothermales bacterium]
MYRLSRLRLFVAAALTLASLSLTGCDAFESQRSDKGQLVASAQTWFEANAPKPGTGKNGADEINVFYPNWEAGAVVEASTGERAVVTTLWRKTEVTYSRDLYFLRVLAVVLDASGDVTKGRIVEFASPDSIGREEGPSLVKRWLEHQLAGRLLWVAEYDVEHTFVQGMRYAEGKPPTPFTERGRTVLSEPVSRSW